MDKTRNEQAIQGLQPLRERLEMIAERYPDDEKRRFFLEQTRMSLDAAVTFARAAFEGTDSADLGLGVLPEITEQVYRERNIVAVGLARLVLAQGGDAWVGIDPEEPEWPVLYVQLPTGQASWHFSPADAHLLADIPAADAQWDGHTTEEKEARLLAISLEGDDDGPQTTENGPQDGQGEAPGEGDGGAEARSDPESPQGERPGAGEPQEPVPGEGREAKGPLWRLRRDG